MSPRKRLLSTSPLRLENDALARLRMRRRLRSPPLALTEPEPSTKPEAALEVAIALCQRLFSSSGPSHHLYAAKGFYGTGGCCSVAPVAAAPVVGTTFAGGPEEKVVQGATVEATTEPANEFEVGPEDIAPTEAAGEAPLLVAESAQTFAAEEVAAAHVSAVVEEDKDDEETPTPPAEVKAIEPEAVESSTSYTTSCMSKSKPHWKALL